MSKKPLASTIVLNEKLLCGGEWISRKQLYDELCAEGNPPRLVDWFLFCLGQGKRDEQARSAERQASE